MSFPTIDTLQDLHGARVLVRAGLNVPVENGVVRNAFRIRKAAETINLLREKGARVIIVAHIGRDPKETLLPVAEAMKEHVSGLTFCDAVVGEKVAQCIEALNEGDAVLLENLRREAGEKKNDPAFASVLASYADIYVNDAFAVAHRAHASTVGVAALAPHFAGLLFAREVEALSRSLEPEYPSLLLLGGAKFATKEALLKIAVTRYNKVFVGGALANDFFKMQGYEVGASLVSDNIDAVADIFASGSILLPVDVLVTGPSGTAVKRVGEVAADETIVDCGPETVTMLGGKLNESKFVLWNGPLGNYEKGFSEHTEEVARLIADTSIHSIVGGGDTVASIEGLGLTDKFSFLSTGGGAMLDFIVDGKLPAIDALMLLQPVT